MKRELLFGIVLGLSTSLPVAYSAEQTMPEAAPALESASLVTISATVTAIDHDKREVTLKDAEGNETTLTVGDEVKNLPQVEVGDNVDIAYYEEVDVTVLSGDESEPRAAAIAALETAEPGQKPAGQLTTDVSLLATIESIDKDSATVTLKGPEGNTKTVKVRDPANLENIAVGDRVLINLTQAIAVDVTKSTPTE